MTKIDINRVFSLYLVLTLLSPQNGKVRRYSAQYSTIYPDFRQTHGNSFPKRNIVRSEDENLDSKFDVTKVLSGL